MNRVTAVQGAGRVRGFTLIEVAVALGILAVVALVAVKAGALYARAYERAESRMLAQFVVENARHRYLIYGAAVGAGESEVLDYAGRRWQLYYEPVSMAALMKEAPSGSTRLTLTDTNRQVALRIYVTQLGETQILADSTFVRLGRGL